MKAFPQHRDAFRSACASVALHAVLAGLLIFSISFAKPDHRRRDEEPRVLQVAWVSTKAQSPPEPAVAGIRKNVGRPSHASAVSPLEAAWRRLDRTEDRARETSRMTDIRIVSLHLPVGLAGGSGLLADGPEGKRQPGGSDRSAANESTAAATPQYLENAPPVYPAVARSRGYAGMVLLIAEIAADGRVENLSIKKSSGYASLDRSALEAVRRWKFDPGRRMGKPVSMWVDVPVKFILKEDDPIS